MAPARGRRRHDRRALCRRSGLRLRARGRSAALPRGAAGEARGVCAFSPSRTRSGSSRSAVMPRRTALLAGSASRRPSTFSASPSFAANRGGQIPDPQKISVRPLAGDAQGARRIPGSRAAALAPLAPATRQPRHDDPGTVQAAAGRCLPKPRILIPGLTDGSPSNTRGGSRMRESRTYGPAQRARSNTRPYRDRGREEQRRLSGQRDAFSRRACAPPPAA